MHPLHHPRLIPNWPTSASLFLAWFRIRFVKGPPVTSFFWKTILATFCKEIFDDKLLGIWHDSTNICKMVVLSENTLNKNNWKLQTHQGNIRKKTPAAETQDLPPSCLTSHLEREVFSCNFFTGPSRIFFWGCRVILDLGLFEISSNSCDILYWYPYCYSALNHQKRLISSTQVVKLRP